MERINKRKRNTIKSLSVQSVNVTFISFKYRKYIDNSIHWILSFYLVVKRLTITRNSVVKFQNLIVNHESQPITSNHVDEIKSIFHSFWMAIIWWKNKNLMKIADTSFKVAIFWCNFSVKLPWLQRKGNKLNTTLFDIIDKIVKPSHLENL